MNKIRTFVRLDKMSGTKDPSKLYSGVYYDESGKKTEVDNGTLVDIGGLIEGERELHKVVPVGEKINGTLGLIATPELEYSEEGYRNIETFTNAAGEPVRIYILEKGDIFSVCFNHSDHYGSGDEIKKGFVLSLENNDGKKVNLSCEDVERVGRHTYRVFMVR